MNSKITKAQNELNAAIENREKALARIESLKLEIANLMAESEGAINAAQQKLAALEQGQSEISFAFEIGKTYWTTSIVDSETIHKITIAKRTAKTITTSEGKVLRISVDNGVEEVKPHGRYSMCAIITAKKELIEG